MNARLAWRTVAAAVAVAAAATAAPAQDAIRPMQSRGIRLLEDGLRRSPSMRALVDELRRSDVVVYVDLDPDEPGALQGSLRFQAATAEVRYLRVWLQPRQCDRALVPLLAHELQHAVEVARAADVRSAETFRVLYETIGTPADGGRYETDAAREVALRVRRELEME